MNERKILKNKIFLYLTEFFAGMSVMAVELGASRLLAPYFSSSQIVWTIIIGTIMIAMALGNIYGGRAADKNPNPDKLYARILVSAIWTALIPWVGKYIIIGVSGLIIVSINENYLIWAAFAACMIVFVFPLFLLGTVTPSLAKYSVDELENSGKVVGTLGAFNTVGSIIGTFLPTFVTIPAVGTGITFLIFSGILLLLSLIYFLSSKTGYVKCGVAAVIFVMASIFGHDSHFAFWQNDLAYEGESVYNYLQVQENDRYVALSTNVLFGVQSVYMKDSELTGMYYDYAMMAPLMTEEKAGGRDVLILGMGTGTYATQCEKYFDEINIKGVEIDEKITGLAGKYFHMNEDIEVTTYDGRAYLNADKNKYDVIMVDAYQDISIPFQMSSVEFFTLVKDHLNDDGVMVVNMNMRSTADDNINYWLADTISSVFDYTYTIDVYANTNCELFATNNSDALKNFSENVGASDKTALVSFFDRVSPNLKVYEAQNRILTDDKAPVELLSMSVMDDIIADEVSYYKEIYRMEGLKGIMSELGM